MQMKSLIAGAVALVFAASASAALKDGTYPAEVLGHNSPLTVKVTIANGNVIAIDSSKNLETRGVGKVGLAKTAAKIIRNQSIGVDAVTGATVSSSAMVEGVKKCLEQAGATAQDMQKWNRNVVSYPTAPMVINSDVAIVGGGGTGLAAALSALENGAKHVVILEKLGITGGSTQVSGGAFNAVDDKRQKAQGIED